MDSPAAKVEEYEFDELDLDDGYASDVTDPGVFKIHDPLLPYTTRDSTTEELHDRIHDGNIDLNPPYQRDVVWPESKQIGLIDSIFRNFYIPPVVFAIEKDEEGENIWICVDGKQRLTSIQRFFDGVIPYRDPKTKKNWWYTIPDNKRTERLELPDHGKRKFAEKKIQCVEYHDLVPGTEREIFQRVQMGMTLTAAEKLQAISSPWAQWISELESRHVSVEGGLSAVLEWDTKRGRDFQNIAHLVFCCDGLPDEHVPTAAKIEKWLVRLDHPGEQFKADIELVLRDFWNMATNTHLNHGFTKIGKRIAPVEFIFIGVLLYVMRNATLEHRADAIYNVRKAIRIEYKDVRNNSNVGKSLWNLINEQKAWQGSSSTSRANGLSGHSESGKGRRKRKADEDEDSEYRPEAPIRSLGKGPKTRAK